MNKESNKKIWGFVYKFRISEKEYIGWTTGLKRRFKAHFSVKKDNFHFHNALRKYFQKGCFSIIETYYDTPKNIESILKEREIFWINKLETFDPKQEKGWNLTKGGDGNLGWVPSTDTLEKMKKPKSEEHKRKLKKPKSEEHKRKLSESLRGNEKLRINGLSSNNPMRGKSVYEIWVKTYGKEIADKKLKEMGRKITKANTGRPHTEDQIKNIKKNIPDSHGEKNSNSKSAILISPDKMEHHTVCVKIFCREYGLCYSNILKVLQGRLRHNKGWTGQYFDNKKENK
jgi:hypothetical protein